MTDSDISGISIIVPAVAIDGDAVIGIAHKDPVDMDIFGAEDVDAVVVAAGAEGFDVADPDIMARAHENGIGVVNDDNVRDADVV